MCDRPRQCARFCHSRTCEKRYAAAPADDSECHGPQALTGLGLAGNSWLAGEDSDTEIGVCAAEVVNGGFFPFYYSAVFLRYVFRLGPGEY
jgi:hypothetical protein